MKRISKRTRLGGLKWFADCERIALAREQVEVPVKHSFGPGVYLREISAKAGTLLIGHEHKTAHWNILLAGKLALLCSGDKGKGRIVSAPMTLLSQAGSRKMAYVLEDARWLSIHPTNETDVEKLEASLVKKSKRAVTAQGKARLCLS